MFGFDKVKVNTNALATLMNKRNFGGVYAVKSVAKDAIVLRGEYLNHKRTNRILKVLIKKDKIFFEDAFGNAITRISQGIKEADLFVQLKEIYNIV